MPVMTGVEMLSRMKDDQRLRDPDRDGDGRGQHGSRGRGGRG